MRDMQCPMERRPLFLWSCPVDYLIRWGNWSMMTEPAVWKRASSCHIMSTRGVIAHPATLQAWYFHPCGLISGRRSWSQGLHGRERLLHSLLWRSSWLHWESSSCVQRPRLRQLEICRDGVGSQHGPGRLHWCLQPGCIEQPVFRGKSRFFLPCHFFPSFN